MLYSNMYYNENECDYKWQDQLCNQEIDLQKIGKIWG